MPAGVRWCEVAAAAPALAAHAEQRLSEGICYFATVRPDGWPRIHPVGVNFRSDALVVVMLPSSPKARDLARNPRFAVHCTVEDNQGGGGEVLVTGTTESVEPTDRDRERGWVAFELLVTEVQATTYDTAAARPVTKRWTVD